MHLGVHLLEVPVALPVAEGLPNDQLEDRHRGHHLLQTLHLQGLMFAEGCLKFSA